MMAVLVHFSVDVFTQIGTEHSIYYCKFVLHLLKRMFHARGKFWDTQYNGKVQGVWIDVFLGQKARASLS